MDLANVLELLSKKGYIQEVDIPTIIEDEDFKKPKKEGKKKKTTEERAGVYDPKKCDARIWKEGYDNIQCGFIKVDGKCLCSRHLEKVDKDGSWWLGMVQEPRPENPVWRGTEHFWRTDKDGNEVTLKKKTKQKEDGTVTKKKRGRPKGSKNKKKPLQKEMTKEEILLLIEKKKKEEAAEKEKEKVKEGKDKDEGEKDKDEKEKGDEEEETTYIVDNVPYELLNGELMDPEDYSPIGKPDGKGGIIFEDEDASEKHGENISKFN